MQRSRNRWRARAAASAIAVACAVTAACSGAGPAPASPRPSRTASGATSAGAGQPAPSPTRGSLGQAQPSSPVPSGSACVPQVLGRLSLAQQVGQLFLVGVAGDVAGPQLTAAMRSYHFGSLLLTKSAAGTAALARQTTAMQSLAPSGTGGIGLFIAANQEGGQIQQLTGPGFAAMPSALVQGGWPHSTLRAAATQWGTDLRAAGREPQPGAGDGRGAGGDGGGQRADRRADEGVRLRPGDQRRARRRVHPGDGRGRGDDAWPSTSLGSGG